MQIIGALSMKKGRCWNQFSSFSVNALIQHFLQFMNTSMEDLDWCLLNIKDMKDEHLEKIVFERFASLIKILAELEK
jgi:hypothetical protein